jgi:hypothetical protein
MAIVPIAAAVAVAAYFGARFAMRRNKQSNGI